VREIEALSSAVDIMVASSFDQVVEAFGKLWSTPGCEEKTFPELGLFLKTGGEVGGDSGVDKWVLLTPQWCRRQMRRC
jgi:hypothetical protein